MERERIVRRALAASAFFNVGGALAFFFPASIGQLAGLPADVPLIYRALVALFVLLFGAAYWWLARQPEIDRPMVTLAAAGKAGAFVVTVLCWLAGSATGLSVLAITGDLLFAAIFAWWLLEPTAGTARDSGTVRPA